MADYKPVPVAEAKRVAAVYGKQMVVMLAYDREHNLTHTTTYGETAFDKENAAAVGELVTQAIGCDLSRKHSFEDFHRDYSPALFRRMVERLEHLARLDRGRFVTRADIDRLLAELRQPAP